MHFEASRAVFWSLSCNKEPKLTIKPFTGPTLGRLLTQKQNISLQSSDMHRKQNFGIVFGFKSYTAVLTFTFRFLYSPLLSLFLPHFVFFGRAFSRLLLVGKVFGKAFRILGLDERKGRWIVEQNFHGKFQVNVTGFLPFSPVSLTEWCSFWYGLKKLVTLHKLADKN